MAELFGFRKMKKVVVLGASPNPERFSNQAVRSLLKRNFTVIPVGIRPGFIEGQAIQTGKPDAEFVDTLLLYLSPRNQIDYYNYIIKLQPRRIIFNPGTENPELITLCRMNQIEVVLDCSLVMLDTG
jgi:predicted CoA-binding protein